MKVSILLFGLIVILILSGCTQPNPQNKPDKCKNDSDCNDSNPCTNDICTGRPAACEYIQKDCNAVGQCQSDSNCDDANYLTIDICNEIPKKCTHTPKICNQIGGNVCSDSQMCSESTTLTVDTNKCCTGECKETFIKNIEIKKLNFDNLPVWTKDSNQYEYLPETEWFRVLVSVHDEKKLADKVKIEIYAFDLSDQNKVIYTTFPQSEGSIRHNNELIYRGFPLNPLHQQDFDANFVLPGLVLLKDDINSGKNKLGAVTPLIFVVSLLSGDTVLYKETKEIKFHNYPFSNIDIIANVEEKTKAIAEISTGHIDINATEPETINAIELRYCKQGYNLTEGIPCSEANTYASFMYYPVRDFNFSGTNLSFDYENKFMFANVGKWQLIMGIFFNTREQPIYIAKELDIKGPS